MDIRQYLASDRSSCLALFDASAKNPASGQRIDFVAFLDHPHCPFFIMEHESEIAGFGGYSVFEDAESAQLEWGMVRRDLRGNGLGRFLLMFRLREIGKLGAVQAVRVVAPKDVARFFEKQGFRRTSESEDEVALLKKLTVCA